MLIQETFENTTKGYLFGESDPYEPFTDDIGKLFKSLQREYGRCTGHVYIDRKDGQTVKVGWVFEKRMKYDDCNEWYTRTVWVTLLDSFERKVGVKHHVL